MMSAAVRSVVLGAFSRPLYTLFANGEDGFLFGDWSELDELFTISTGPTAVATDSDPVGLALDDRSWGVRTLAEQLAQATELLVAGSWSMSVAGGTSTAVESPAGTLTLISDGTNGARGDQAITTVVGRTYRIAASNSGAGSANINIGTTQGGTNVMTGVTVSPGQTSAFYFVATSTTTWVRFIRSVSFASAVVHSISCKEVGGNHALQTTTTHRPLWRANSGKPYLSFDGSDDNLLSRYVPGPVGCLAFAGVCSGNSRMALGGELTPGRLYFGLNAAGALGAGVGSNSYVIHSDNVSRSGVTGVGLLTYDGSTVRLYWDGALIYSGAQSGAVGATPIRLGAGGATANFFWSGAIYAALAMNRVPSAPEIALITSQFQRTYQ